jgi:hypothetical protein
MPIDDSYLLIDSDGCHTKSDGYFQLVRILGGWWRLALIGKVVPDPRLDLRPRRPKSISLVRHSRAMRVVDDRAAQPAGDR